MKAEELRALDADELGGRLRGARRELYELRFKLAVGQQDNHREVRKARKEIARILTVVHQRRLEAVDEGDFEQRLAGSQPEGAEEAAETAGSVAAATAEATAEAGAEEAETTSAAATAGEPATAEAEAGTVSEETTTEEGPATDADKAPTRRRGRKASSEDEEA
jgi:large subunit ribosomal protein L29